MKANHAPRNARFDRTKRLLGCLESAGGTRASSRGYAMSPDTVAAVADTAFSLSFFTWKPWVVGLEDGTWWVSWWLVMWVCFLSDLLRFRKPQMVIKQEPPPDSDAP